MKKCALFLILLAVVFGGSYFAAGGWKRPLERREDEGFEARFAPNPFPLQNRFFTVVAIGRNNGASLQKTLASLFSQNYENYRILYIDDASDDGSFDLASDLICESSQAMRITAVQNKEPLGFLANLYRAVASCGDEEIVVVVKGDDWLAHEWVLQRLNAYYSDPDLWASFSQYCETPYFDAGGWPVPESWKEKKFRSQPLATPHLKTFYAALFKKIRQDDFLDSGKFLSGEAAYTVPLLEMAEGHFGFIPEVLYVSHGGAASQENSEFVQSLACYSPLVSLFSEDAFEAIE